MSTEFTRNFNLKYTGSEHHGRYILRMSNVRGQELFLVCDKRADLEPVAQTTSLAAADAALRLLKVGDVP